MQAEEVTARDRQRQHHGEPAEDGATDEVRREEGRVPARQLRHREVERHDRVHRQPQRRATPGAQERGLREAVPVAARTRPPQGEEAVDCLGDAGLGLVPEGGQVGDHPDVPEERRHAGVGRDREDVPQQRASELRPHAHLVGIREEPVGEPDAADMQRREQAGAHNCEDGHGLGKAVDAGAPILAEEEENGTDERAGVADADPEDEVDDVKGPGDGLVIPPHTDACGEQIGDGEAQATQEGKSYRETDIPGKRCLPDCESCDVIGDVCEPLVANDQRRTDTGVVPAVVEVARGDRPVEVHAC